ncbi:hypothetical protein QTP86_023466 [Hemibagrus guttatus]|nr:hypothetical protein QTP86_023466 [Hemibagrus guttatus]
MSNRFALLSEEHAEKPERALVIGDSILRHVKLARPLGAPAAQVRCIPGARVPDIAVEFVTVRVNSPPLSFSECTFPPALMLKRLCVSFTELLASCRILTPTDCLLSPEISIMQISSLFSLNSISMWTLPREARTHWIPHLGYSDHISVMLIPAYRPLVRCSKPVLKQVKTWPAGTISALQDCFGCTDWKINLEEYTTSVTSYIRKCINDVTVSKTITTHSNQKLWMTAEVRALLKSRD